jgi:hypothetical protein
MSKSMPPSAQDTITTKLRKFLPQFEGNVTWMYLDRNGLVHTGIGFNIDKESDYLKLTWYRNSDHAPAKKGEVRAEWQGIHDMQDHKDENPGYFKPFTTLYLEEAEVEKRFREMVKERDSRLRTIFEPDYDTFPADARMAMLVHAWAIDPKRLLLPREKKGWPAYAEACRGREWGTAYTQSHWKGMNPRRYKGMKLMFENAHALEKAHERNRAVDLSHLYYPEKAPF